MTCNCELCGTVTDDPGLTSDSHPAGPNYVVCRECVREDSNKARRHSRDPVERLEVFVEHHDSSVLAVPKFTGDGVLLYSDGASRTGGRPCIEVEAEELRFADITREFDSTDEMLDAFDLEVIQREGLTYIVPDEGGDAR